MDSHSLSERVSTELYIVDVVKDCPSMSMYQSYRTIVLQYVSDCINRGDTKVCFVNILNLFVLYLNWSLVLFYSVSRKRIKMIHVPGFKLD